MNILISAVKGYAEIRSGQTLAEDSIFVQLPGEKPENHPELIPIDHDNNIELYEPLSDMLTVAKEIVSDEGLQKLADQLDNEVENIRLWTCKDIGVNKNGDLILRLTANNSKVLENNNMLKSNIENEVNWYFSGYVRLISGGFINAKYSLVNNGSIIKVRNTIHVRLVENKNFLPDEFKIITPLDFVKIKSGWIPEENKFRLANHEYLTLRAQYHGV